MRVRSGRWDTDAFTPWDLVAMSPVPLLCHLGKNLPLAERLPAFLHVSLLWCIS